MKLLKFTIKTLQRWNQKGKAKFIRTPNGQRRLSQTELNKFLGLYDKNFNKKLAIYARVSSHEQKTKGDLDWQIEFVSEVIKKERFKNIVVVKDVGSGLNAKRKGLLNLMKMAENQEIIDIAISYRDRLTRFGFEYLDVFFKSHNVTIHILDEREDERNIQEELVEDLMSIIANFSGKLYGIRSHKNKILKDKVKGAIEDVANLSDQVENDTTSSRLNL
jgi:putative resolvase